MLGPLTNPARPTSAAVGCFDLRMAPVMAAVFARRGDSALVMRGEDGLDEFTTAAPTRVWMARDGTVEEAVVDATDLGLPRSKPGDLRGGDAAYNADAARRMFAGETGPGPRRGAAQRGRGLRGARWLHRRLHRDDAGRHRRGPPRRSTRARRRQLLEPLGGGRRSRRRQPSARADGHVDL